MLKEDKMKFIKDYIEKEIKELKNDLEDKSLYKKNEYYKEKSFIQNIEEGSDK